MSDLGRKGFGDKAQEKITPDSQKSTLDKASETVTDAGDKAARSLQPEQDKSATQSIGDSISGNKDQAAHGGSGQSVLDKAKDTLGLGKQ